MRVLRDDAPGGRRRGVRTRRPPPAPAELGASEVRKPATFIFVDLKGSTALTERIDQEAMSEIKKRYFTVMAAQIERHGGTIEKYIGDAIMAVFGIPRAHEDDALRAVRAAHGMQQELAALNEDFQRFYGVELANRTGVNTGEVVANTDPTANQQLATGDTVNVAARLEQAAPANEILIGETTYDLVRGHVEVEAVEPLELKGKSERVPAFRLMRVRDPGEAGPRRPGRCARRRSSGAPPSWASSRNAWPRRSSASAAWPSPSSATRAWARPGSSATSPRATRAMPGCCAAAACPMATASRSGRWPRSPGMRPASPRTTRPTWPSAGWPPPSWRPARTARRSPSGWPRRWACRPPRGR